VGHRSFLLQEDLLVILMTMNTQSLAEAKAHLSELVQRVHGQHERITVTVHGKPHAVLLSTEDLERLEETIAVLSDSDMVQQLAQSSADLAAGRVETLDQLAKYMSERGATA
jgi:antitoxin YefM